MSPSTPIFKVQSTPRARMDSNKITEIVRLQRILKKWRKLATSSKPNSNAANSSSKSIKFLKRTLSLSDNNSARETSSNAGAVPKGYLAVCVGEELKRFIIPTHYLGHPAFHTLLREAEEEFGFQQAGVLTFPCQVPVFETILKLVEAKQDVYLAQDCSLVRCSSNTHHTPSQSPMCR
ncbi:protein SMALL AUXIN UP-REGULATED RNA 9 [Mercurialis annua]|uniref:protein SMALL AUXIN UP-REGULATED RNA 9 n=1 Tax=Mercurialis annua TaxID=3986 RepID=UPI00215DD929|nr:protein SMALL AUXIN UP-REGULATED RNA 9 [Mercurialis annua]